MKTFGINGFGRIGRTSFRVWWSYYKDSCDLKMINTSGSMELDQWAHLLKYDSNYGVWQQSVTVEKLKSTTEVTDDDALLGYLIIDDRKIAVTAQKNPVLIPWKSMQVETVIDSTGVFLTQEKASMHLQAGASKVILSGPAKGPGIPTAVISVNQSTGQLASNASCTTNCVAPVTAVIMEQFGVVKAIMSTIHAYTDDQNLQDNSHRDLRRSRSAAKSIIPTSTGAAIAVTETLPELKNLFDGVSYRVPVSVGSIADMVFVTKRATSVEEVNQKLKEAALSARYQGILAVTDEPIVSADIVGRRESSIVDLALTQVVGGDLVKVVSWYDNEFGYCNRLIEQVING